MIKIYAIRHGETNGNKRGVLQGWTDEPLNEKGRGLAVVTAKGLANVKFDKAYSSPLSRAFETAEIILKHNNNPTPEIIKDERIKEIRFGEWEGMGISPENFNIPSDNFNTFYQNPFKFQNAPNGESCQQVCERTGNFYQKLINDPGNEGKTILIAIHGFAIRALLQQVYEDKSDFWHGQVPPNCSVNIIEVENGKSRLIGDDIVFYDKILNVNPYHPIG